LNGHGDWDGDIDILGIYTSFQLLFVVIGLAPMTWFANLIIINLVLLHRPSDWSRFLNNIMGDPILSLMLWLGNVEIVNEFRNSGVMISMSSFVRLSDLSMESALRYSFGSPVK